ncbi:MFS transporter [Salinibacterium sp. SYSU T00001]|uniref:MFS transporter n=1 Tax=Homoserinimonas sedimenticola TaxID=2986805 RepID=UPI0022360C8A|nr:MFS transporter [Salinibacterium sedimenticola]MCW4385699.1 MFS transporter [Salinibacterium sedimenticola]
MSREQSPRSAWWIGIVAGMASYIDAAAIVSTGIALVLYQMTFGFTEFQFGALSAALTLGVAVGALVGGRLGDRFGRRSVFIVTMLMIVVGSATLVFSASFPLLFVAILLLGLGTGADLPVSLATIAEAATDKNRGKLIGFSQVLWYGGILATVGISTAVGGMGHLGGQILFGHVGVIALIVLVLRVGIPESEVWRDAHTAQLAAVEEGRPKISVLRALLTDRRYVVPFLALLVFYTLVNLAANTTGQFGTYVAVNIVGISVQANSIISLVTLPVGILLGFWFMRVVDSRHRMAYYVFGAIASTLGLAAPAIFGFSLVTLVLIYVGAAVGGSFAFEAIMKVWTQESFPPLLRASAQGGIIAFARLVAAGVALVTPMLLNAAQLAYGLLAIIVAIGYFVTWLAFHKRPIPAETDGVDVHAESRVA